MNPFCNNVQIRDNVFSRENAIIKGIARKISYLPKVDWNIISKI